MIPVKSAGFLKVLFLSDRLSARGGADRHLVGVLDLLQARPGIETLLAVGRDDGSLPEGERSGLGSWQRIKGLDRSGLKDRGRTGAKARLEKLIEAFQPGLIHLQNVIDPELIRLAAGLAPAMVTVQDHRFFCPGLGMVRPDGRPCQAGLSPACLACFTEAGYGRRLLSLTQERLRALGGAAGVLVLSDYMGRCLTRAGLVPDLVETLPPFVHGLGSDGRPGPGGFHLLAGRLVERKGVRVALEAAGLMRSSLPLVVAGDGPLATEAARAAEGSGGRIRFRGWADRQEMGRLLAGARSLWLPSLWAEPFGIAGLEALSQGVPVIAARGGGVEEWLDHGRTGLLVSRGDPRALARAADRLAGEEELARALGRAGQKEVRAGYDPRRLMERLVSLYAGIARPNKEGVVISDRDANLGLPGTRALGFGGSFPAGPGSGREEEKVT